MVSFEKGNPEVVTIGDNKYVKFTAGLRVRANFGKRKIYFYALYNEGTDEFALYVCKQIGVFKSKVIREYVSLPLENFREVYEQTYNELVQSEMQGFIPL